MSRSILKTALKRGALVAAANWPVTLIQATADSLFKLLLAAPVIGSIFLVALAVGSDPLALLSIDSRELAMTIAASLMARPLILGVLVLAVAIVGVGGSFFVFLVKAGTVATLVRSEREAGPIEEPPLRVSVVTRASRFTIDQFIESARSLFPRYARLGLMLMVVYVISAIGYLLLVVRPEPGGWFATALITAAFVVWVTTVNLIYLLIQIVVAAEDCSVASASRRVAAFIRRERRHVLGVFLLVFAVIVGATGASVLATAALGLVAFVPFVGLAALPLQLAAWLLRGLVFQYLGLASVGAYLSLYRRFAATGPEVRTAGAYGHAWGPT